ncbi:hypothetical protein [Clostridium sp. Marseille-Q2269]|nr:hypothetical protein [Clostridium sp. Marseille-Q2269]
MWAILLFLFIGIIIGYFKQFSEKSKNINSILQQIGVLVKIIIDNSIIY